MKTLEQVKSEYKSKTIDGRDLSRLARFIPEPDLAHFGLELKPEFIGKHVAEPMTREAVLDQLRKDVDFGFEKALDQRGISASLMFEVVSMWNWILEEGLEGHEHEGDYGLSLFRATADRYGFPRPDREVDPC